MSHGHQGVTLWFGPSKGKKVAELTDTDLVGLVGWVRGLLDGPTAPSGAKKRQWTRLLMQLEQELGSREGDEVPDSPVTILQHLTPAQAKVVLTMLVLRNEQGSEVFRAPRSLIMTTGALGGEHAVTQARQLLANAGLLKEIARGEYRFIGGEGAGKTLCPDPLLSSLLSKKEEEPIGGGDTVSYEHVDRALALMRIKADDSTRLAARKKLQMLVSTGTYTVEDAITVAQWARRSYDSGDDRWTLLNDITYIWTMPRFAGFLGAAKAPNNPKAFESILDPDDRASMRAEHLRIIKERGLT